jgi:hypothetical protein
MTEIIKEFIKTFRHELAQKDTEHVIFHGCWTGIPPFMVTGHCWKVHIL